MNDRICIATMESESLTWVATGFSKEEAQTALLKKWNKYQRRLVNCKRKDVADYFNDYDELSDVYDVTIIEINVGDAVFW